MALPTWTSARYLAPLVPPGSRSMTIPTCRLLFSRSLLSAPATLRCCIPVRSLHVLDLPPRLNAALIVNKHFAVA